MRKLTLASGILVLCGVSLAEGQAPSGQAGSRYFPSRPHSKAQLLTMYPEIQKELKLTEPQKARLRKIQEQHRQDGKQYEAVGRNLAAQAPDQETKNQIHFENRYSGVLRFAALEPAMSKVLDRQQRIRLDQIQLQAAGPACILLPDVPQRLNLSPEQIEAIRAMYSEGFNEQTQLGKELRKRPDPGPSDKAASLAESQFRMQKLSGFRQSFQSRFLSILRKKQRATYQKMLGAPFIVDGHVVEKTSNPPEPRKDDSE